MLDNRKFFILEGILLGGQAILSRFRVLISLPSTNNSCKASKGLSNNGKFHKIDAFPYQYDIDQIHFY
jgi:hypothetical protein